MTCTRCSRTSTAAGRPRVGSRDSTMRWLRVMTADAGGGGATAGATWRGAVVSTCMLRRAILPSPQSCSQHKEPISIPLGITGSAGLHPPMHAALRCMPITMAFGPILGAPSSESARPPSAALRVTHTRGVTRGRIAPSQSASRPTFGIIRLETVRGRGRPTPFLLSILSDPRASISHATLIPPPAPNPHFPTGWLKEQRDASRPAVNMRGEYTAKYRARHGHHHAPPRVAWVSGVPVSKLRGRPMTNGTWSGRAVW